MRFLAVFLILSISSTCSKVEQKKYIEEDLSFKMIDLFNISDLHDTTVLALKKYIETEKPDTLGKQDLKIYKLLKAAIEADLINKPSVFLKDDSGKSHRLFLNDQQYQKLKDFKCFDLRAEGKKVRIKAEVEVQIIEGLEFYIAQNIESFEKIDGETLCRK